MANSRTRRKRALIKRSYLELVEAERDKRIERDKLVSSNLSSLRNMSDAERHEAYILRKADNAFKSSVSIVSSGLKGTGGTKRDSLYDQTLASRIAKPGYVREGVKPVKIDTGRTTRGEASQIRSQERLWKKPE